MDLDQLLTIKNSREFCTLLGLDTLDFQIKFDYHIEYGTKKFDMVKNISDLNQKHLDIKQKISSFDTIKQEWDTFNKNELILNKLTWSFYTTRALHRDSLRNAVYCIKDTWLDSASKIS